MPSLRLSNGIVAIVVAAVCGLELIVMGRAVTPLVIALLISHLIWSSQSTWRSTRELLTAYGASVLVQCLHLVEEYRTGFYIAFPPVFRAAAWSPGRFLAFNLVWLGVFIAAGIGVAISRRPAYLVALFLGFGGIGNGLGHLALAARRGEYFPGAYTAVLTLFAGSALLRALLRPETRPETGA